ncbi:divalent-cation tolerance protein CutA [Chelativorans sp. M5D2P16]|uniref:divalent-cation tolerance protein CutA n=1 Tax=Chelativorans sp. M5D2P16 TaxID=3095678 RepID=UPI002ACAD74F|nr:divalent-cation tolerance protein CutA [Chelativorans sp. M5D2P16]MDZ5697371.1 divalent-cation tolerance protein CutA [Chelativorans sp. M5D2P16]
MTMHFIDIWVNCPDRETAVKIAEAVIGDKLAACANIFAPIQSLYRWQGVVEQGEEVPLLLKTRAEHFDAVCAAVRPLHPYEVPSITATAITDVDQEYADWLRKETREPA